MATTLTPEPEELLESKLATLLSASCTIPVEGMLTPASVGTVKNLTADTFVGVKVDQTSQDGDYVYRSPFTYAATVTVHYALADDASGYSFRDECRRVRAALLTLTGDGCSALNVQTLSVDEFLLDTTYSNFESGDNPTNTKSYSATIKGRIIQPTTEAE